MGSSIRISGGKARNILIKSPGIIETRPAMDVIRQAIFSSLGSEAIVGTSCIDLFAGTGAYGLEALSRGAIRCLFIEKNSSLRVLLKENIQKLCSCFQKNDIPLPQTEIIIMDIFNLKNPEAFHFSKVSAKERSQLIFVGAPYPLVRVEAQNILSIATTLLAKESKSRIFFELPAELDLPLHPALEVLKRLGKNKSHSPSIGIYRWNTI